MRIKHGHKGRCNYEQHGPGVFCIYRTLIQQRLLVKFSCKLLTIYLLKRFTHYRSFVFCDKWLLQHILGYPLMAVLEMFKEQKIAIISVRQDYESTETRNKYRTGIRTIYGGREILMDIRKSRDNFDKDGKLRCFNCNIYRHMAKECQRPKKEREIRKCYKYNIVEHIIRDCRSEQKIKNRSI